MVSSIEHIKTSEHAQPDPVPPSREENQEASTRGSYDAGATNTHANSKTSRITALKRRTIICVMALVTVVEMRRSQNPVVSNAVSSFSTTKSPFTSLHISAETTIDNIHLSTGADLHLANQYCGQTWSEYMAQFPQGKDSSRPIQWTVGGGDDYRESAKAILSKWRTLGLNPVLVVAMDPDVAEAVCLAGFSAVYWDNPKASYSRVADAKFSVAADIAEKGYPGFFIEMDVFCRQNPVPMFMRYPQDLVSIGHGDMNYKVNIGVWLASPRMGPFFRGLIAVMRFSLDTPEMKRNDGNDTIPWFDQDVYHYCLPIHRSSDDDLFPEEERFYLDGDLERKTDLLEFCRVWSDFNHTIVPHHIMQAHEPPTIYDSTICIHPLAATPFTPLAFKLGAAQFYGWDPTPIGPDEKLLKTLSGDFEYAACWNRGFSHNDYPKFDEYRAQHIVAVTIASMVEIAYQTNRTLVLPRFLRSDEAHGVPTHALVDVRTLDVPYRFMTIEESYELESEDLQVVQASRAFYTTLNKTLEARYADSKILAIDKVCHIRDFELPIIEERKAKMSWCLDIELAWTRANGGFENFCGTM